MAEPEATGRRAYDDPAGLVVPLREHLEDKITASHNELKGEISHLRADMATGQAQSSLEHAEVRKDLANLHTAVARLVADGNREQGASALKSSLWKATAAVIAAMAALTGIVAALAGLL